MFKQPFLDRVKAALESAYSITWDECHKIYILLDEVSDSSMGSCGYDCIPVTDKDAALRQLFEWFDKSCPLKFIQSIANDVTFVNVIGQCDPYDDEEDDFEDEDE